MMTIFTCFYWPSLDFQSSLYQSYVSAVTASLTHLYHWEWILSMPPSVSFFQVFECVTFPSSPDLYSSFSSPSLPPFCWLPQCVTCAAAQSLSLRKAPLQLSVVLWLPWLLSRSHILFCSVPCKSRSQSGAWLFIFSYPSGPILDRNICKNFFFTSVDCISCSYWISSIPSCTVICLFLSPEVFWPMRLMALSFYLFFCRQNRS